MKYFLMLLIIASLTACQSNTEKQSETNQIEAVTEPVFFELRTYYCYPDRLDNLLTRFEDHTMALFEKHGMVNLGYWVPIDNTDNKLVYLLGYQSKEQRDEAWKAFGNDPAWKKVWEASRVDGPIVDSVVNTFLTYTSYSPKLKVEDKSPRIFSHRTYYANEGKLGALHERFQNHTLEIFENNGMTNIAYFNLDNSHPESKNVLTYLITFPDTTARKNSWKKFSTDPAWKRAYANSIENGKLVDSLTAELMLPKSFSPLK